MVDDPYQTLGVARDAKSEEVRRAYRQAAKRAHPDGGGSREAFERIASALAVLTDEKRRAHYDRTGEVGERPVDRRGAEAMTIVMNAVDAVLAAIFAKRARPEQFDIIADAIVHLERVVARVVAEGESKKREMREQVQAMRALAKRFRSKKKDKPNRIGAMFSARADEIQRNIGRSDEEVEAIDRAIAVLKDHAFDVDASGSYYVFGESRHAFSAGGVVS